MIFRATDNVFVQQTASPAATLPWTEAAAPLAAGAADCLTHLIPFYRDPKGTGVQDRTADSVRRAHALQACTVRRVSATLEDEVDSVPAGFEIPVALRRSVLDLRAFAAARPLPVLFDILDVGAAAAGGEGYLIFSNADICVQPHFYSSVRMLLREGFDCLIINRRTVGEMDTYRESPELAAFETGKAHPGFDCFVFPARWLGDFVRSDACVGIGFVMRSLLYNLVARADRLLLLKDACLTYHYGDDRSWESGLYADYLRHNRSQAAAVLDRLVRERAAGKRLAAYCSYFQEPSLNEPERLRPRWLRRLVKTKPAV